MKVYLLGTNGQSSTNGNVLITVELLKHHTDMKGITMYNGRHIVSPFYRKLKLNAGRVERITDLEEENDYSKGSIGGTNIELNKYFYVDTSNVSQYLTAYQYKVGVLEQSGYVSKGYNGTLYTHHESGNIKVKTNYKIGNVHSKFYYRDDPYNSLEKVVQYNNDCRVDCEFLYDSRETLLKQLWYNSKGRIYHKVNHETKESVSANSVFKSSSSSSSNSEPELQVTSVSLSESDSDSDSDSDSEPNLGNDKGLRVKPRDVDEDN